MDAQSTIRRALQAAKSVAAGVGLESPRVPRAGGGPVKLGLRAGPDDPQGDPKDFVSSMYAKYPRNPLNNREFVMPLAEDGGWDQFAGFQLHPSAERPGHAHVSFMYAYPQKSGVGKLAMARLQEHAKEADVGLDLSAWENGKTPVSKLRKFYRDTGFTQIGKSKMGNSFAWRPDGRPAKASGGPILDPKARAANLHKFMEGSHPETFEDGAPKVLHHGTLSDFKEFGNASPTAHHGAGIYMTDTPADASHNYASIEGPDQSTKLELAKEEIEGDEGHDPDTGEDPTVTARHNLGFTHEGLHMPLHASMKNPVVIGGDHHTKFTYEEPYNEETEEFGEPSGTLINLIDGIQRTAAEMGLSKFDEDAMIAELHERAMDNGGIDAREAERVIKSHGNVDDLHTGYPANNEFWRRSLENAGHDGIIDHDVYKKFGPKPEYGIRGMFHVYPETTHYVAFHPEQVKSAIGNNGNFDPRERDITKAEGGQVGLDTSQPRQLNKLGLYSAAAEAARNLPQERGTAQQMIASLKGVKPDEIAHSGVNSRWAPNDKISREDLASHFEQALPNIDKDTRIGEDTKYSNWSTKPGLSGGGYRETLLKYNRPKSEERSDAPDAYRDAYRDMGGEELHGGGNYDDYHSDHWEGNPNVLVHYRASDRYEPGRRKPPPKTNTMATIGMNRDDDGNYLKEPAFKQVPAWKTGVPGFVAHKALVRGEGVTLTHAPSGLAMGKGLDHQGAMDLAKRLYEIRPDWHDLTQEQIKEVGKSNPEFVAAVRGAITHHEAASRSRNIAPAAGGRHALLLDELQSDWGQQGREFGILSPNPNPVERNNKPSAVPHAPYIDSTQKWTDLGLKAALHEAAKGNHSHILWPPGSVQAKRYSLSHAVSRLELGHEHEFERNDWFADPPRTVKLKVSHLMAYKGKMPVFSKILASDEIHSHVGKEIAERLLSAPPDETGRRVLSGPGLEVGGQGMKGYYDNILPKRLLAIAHEHDPEAKIAPYKSKDKNIRGFPSLEITPKMRESILKNGFKAFKRGGRVNTEPTEGQKAAGNYAKHHLSLHGLQIAIENRKGSTRSGKDADGKRWKCTLPADYGYIKRTEGADGDHVDCYIGPHPDSRLAFIVNQRDARTRKFDEVKVMFGYNSEAEAVRDYVKAFSDGKGSLRMGGVQSMSIDAFKAWLKRGDTTKRANYDEIIGHALSISRALK